MGGPILWSRITTIVTGLLPCCWEMATALSSLGYLLAAGLAPSFVVVGDFNGDGKADLAATNFNGMNVSVFLGNGDGTFRPQVVYDVGSYPDSIAVADFNGDGKADLAVVNESDQNVSVLLGNGDGTFQPPS